MNMLSHLPIMLCLGASFSWAAEQPAGQPSPLNLAAQACLSEESVYTGSDGWLFLMAELRHLSLGKFWGEEAAAVSKARKPTSADPLPAILDFKRQLDKAGVTLLLLPVPTKASVYPEAIMGASISPQAPARGDVQQQAFYQILRQEGVTVIDVLPQMLAQRGESDGPIYCRTDTHWAAAGIDIAAKAIAKELGNADWLQGLSKTPSYLVERDISLVGDLEGMKGGSQQETLSLQFIGSDEKATAAIPADRESPILLLGDSHTLVFHAGNDMHAIGAGLPDHLLHELGVAVDVIGVRGSGATPARINLMRRVRSDATYLSGKKVIIWCFTVREFSEASGWDIVPLSK